MKGLVRLWWKHESGSMDEDLKPFRNDIDATAMSDYAHDNKCDVELYVEPKVNLGNAINIVDVIGEQKGNGVVADEIEGNVGEAYSDGGDVSSDDGDSVKGIHFDDSEEERMDGVDDGFNNVISEPQLDPNNATEDDVDGVTGGVRNLAKSLLVVAVDDVTNGPNLERPTRCLITPEMEKEHVIEDEYMTDELDSASDNSSDGEGRPAIVRFREDEEMTEKFKFKVGMEFSSLKQFKSAILEHNVLNGNEVKFKKNDARRCRVISKQKEKCKYLVLCSRVVRTTTFKIKTLLPKHTCGWAFWNKNANAEWVAKEVFDRMKNNKMQINDVVDDINQRFSVEIPGTGAFKARKLAVQLVEGDSSKQYSLLWSYSAELRRASNGNNCMLDIETLGPGLQPSFGRYYICFYGCKKAINNACRPFIGLDGCHLKNQYEGILLIVVGRDPND